MKCCGLWFASTHSVGGSQLRLHGCLLVTIDEKAKCDPQRSRSETGDYALAAPNARCKMNHSSQDERPRITSGVSMPSRNGANVAVASFVESSDLERLCINTIRTL